MVSFLVKGGARAASQLIDACQLSTLAPSLGSVETLIEQPSLMSYFELTPEQREAIGIKDSLVRYAVGVEDPTELIDDLLAALAVLD